jgi:hypothetical protein
MNLLVLVKFGEILDWLKYYFLLKMDYTPKDFFIS